MSIGGSSISRRETVVTLVACVLLGWEVVSSLLFSLAILLGLELSPYASLISTLGYEILLAIPGLVLGGVLSVVLLRQGGVSIPSRGERGATKGAIIGIVAGLAIAFFGAVPITGSIGICVLVGLAVGRTFDRTPIRPTS